MTRYRFEIECVDGGYGWGNTGQKGVRVMSGDTKAQAREKIKPQLPGGWLISPGQEETQIDHDGFTTSEIATLAAGWPLASIQ